MIESPKGLQSHKPNTGMPNALLKRLTKALRHTKVRRANGYDTDLTNRVDRSGNPLPVMSILGTRSPNVSSLIIVRNL